MPVRKRRATKRKAVKKCLPKTMSAFGRRYHKKAKHKTKAAATARANRARKSGKTAMVKKDCGGYSVFVGAKKRTAKRK